MSASEDQADVSRVLAGDAEAFEAIVRRWQGPLVNLAYRFCRDRGRAEDMAQEAFLRAYRGLAGWRGEGAFSTWLFALAANVYRSELERIPMRGVPLEDVVPPRHGRAFDAGLEERERDRLLRRAVLALPAKYRDAITLFYFHEQDVGAAASSLGLPEGTLKARLARGRDMLRAKLGRRSAHLETKEA